MSADLTPSMLTLLGSIVDGRVHERFGAEWNTAKALKRRGLAQIQWIGMRYWKIRITPAGLKAVQP